MDPGMEIRMGSIPGARSQFQVGFPLSEFSGKTRPRPGTHHFLTLDFPMGRRVRRW
jgi:hypothetical protein